jgi:hypothetical protein
MMAENVTVDGTQSFILSGSTTVGYKAVIIFMNGRSLEFLTLKLYGAVIHGSN